MSTTPRDLRQPHHACPFGMIGHVSAAEEGQHVVLAEAVDVDVLDDHHLVVADVEECVVPEDLARLQIVAARSGTASDFAIRFGRAFEEPVATGDPPPAPSSMDLAPAARWDRSGLSLIVISP